MSFNCYGVRSYDVHRTNVCKCVAFLIFSLKFSMFSSLHAEVPYPSQPIPTFRHHATVRTSHYVAGEQHHIIIIIIEDAIIIRVVIVLVTAVDGDGIRFVVVFFNPNHNQKKCQQGVQIIIRANVRISLRGVSREDVMMQSREFSVWKYCPIENK